MPGYSIIGEMHRGGQGVIYQAHHASTKRVVALKLLLEGSFASESKRARFEREIDIASTLHHPHIATIYDRGITTAGRLAHLLKDAIEWEYRQSVRHLRGWDPVAM